LKENQFLKNKGKTVSLIYLNWNQEKLYGEDSIWYLCADISELTADTGWKPSTSFENGIRKMLPLPPPIGAVKNVLGRLIMERFSFPNTIINEDIKFIIA
jgi:hypothetical protein